MYKILVFDRGFPQIPIARSGILKNPSGSTPCPRASAPASVRRFAPLSGLRSGPRARRAALGDFKNPLRAQGIWVKIPSQKPEFSILISRILVEIITICR